MTLYTRNNKLLVTSNGHLLKACPLPVVNSVLFAGITDCECADEDWPSDVNGLYDNFVYLTKKPGYVTYTDTISNSDWTILCRAGIAGTIYEGFVSIFADTNWHAFKTSGAWTGTSPASNSYTFGDCCAAAAFGYDGTAAWSVSW